MIAVLRGRAGVRRRLGDAVLALLLAVLAVLAPSYLAPPALASESFSLRDPFSRETVRPGAVDTDPYHIAHVYEVQRRLQRLGLFRATPNGRFGPATTAAVRAFQRRNGLRATGIVDQRTWRPLIRQSVRGRSAVPRACRSAGWHACYDRSWHQVNLYRDGTMLNSWLVRGGAASTPTLTGTYRVYWRHIDHVSTIFDDAPMPYAQFFHGGQALHGSRLMMDPYVGHSHGCVNFWTEDAQQLWALTSSRTLWVHVYGHWS
ncbi:MAG TPA: L,D-transpeptidase family protein [Marmoricola sp.]|nr:L,D-transpeptidase family protein [Marmoricola sp.]